MPSSSSGFNLGTSMWMSIRSRRGPLIFAPYRSQIDSPTHRSSGKPLNPTGTRIHGRDEDVFSEPCDGVVVEHPGPSDEVFLQPPHKHCLSPHHLSAPVIPQFAKSEP